MDEDRIRAICLASSSRCTVKIFHREAEDVLAAGPDILVTREGESASFCDEVWLQLRADIESEMRRQGYDLVGWLSMSDDGQHGLAWVPAGSTDPHFLRKLW